MKLSYEYIAGFVDGEGCLYSRRKSTRPSEECVLEIVNSHLETLALIRESLGGVGRIGPRKGGSFPGSSKPQWRLQIGGNRQLHGVLVAITPFLVQKRKQAERLLELMAQQWEQQEGRRVR